MWPKSVEETRHSVWPAARRASMTACVSRRARGGLCEIGLEPEVAPDSSAVRPILLPVLWEVFGEVLRAIVDI